MINPSHAFSSIPSSLRDPLLEQYASIVKNYMEHRWTPSELSGGKLCEIVYTILSGYATGTYPSKPMKPSNFVDACRKLENYSHVPRSFQILIPRLLPVLYEIRNNRGVGHVGGDVDPNHIDAVMVLSMSNWLMAELIRVFHSLKIDEAQKVVDSLVERRVPLVWQSGNMKRVLKPDLSLQDQILLLISSSPSEVKTDDLFVWVDYKDRAYFNKLLRQLHRKRQIELSKDESYLQILPPGSLYIEKMLGKIK